MPYGIHHPVGDGALLGQGKDDGVNTKRDLLMAIMRSVAFAPPERIKTPELAPRANAPFKSAPQAR